MYPSRNSIPNHVVAFFYVLAGIGAIRQYLNSIGNRKPPLIVVNRLPDSPISEDSYAVFPSPLLSIKNKYLPGYTVALKKFRRHAPLNHTVGVMMISALLINQKPSMISDFRPSRELSFAESKEPSGFTERLLWTFADEYCPWGQL